MSVRYEIRSGLKDKVDYNGDGKVDGTDNVVVKYINNVPVGQILLTKKNEKQLINLLKKQQIADAKAAVKPGGVVDPQQRIIYSRSPPRNPPPLVVQDNTSFGQHLKTGVALGAGLEVGELAVDGAVDLLGNLFS